MLYGIEHQILHKLGKQQWITMYSNSFQLFMHSYILWNSSVKILFKDFLNNGVYGNFGRPFLFQLLHFSQI